MSTQIVTPELRDWIVAQAAAGHSPEVVVEAMKASGWEEPVARIALATTLGVIVTGALHFDPKVAFDLPPDAFKFSMGLLFGLGAASRIGIYDYLGYYDICYLGDEVRDPGRVIPRSIMISVLAVTGMGISQAAG